MPLPEKGRGFFIQEFFPEEVFLMDLESGSES